MGCSTLSRPQWLCCLQHPSSEKRYSQQKSPFALRVVKQLGVTPGGSLEATAPLFVILVMGLGSSGLASESCGVLSQ